MFCSQFDTNLTPIPWTKTWCFKRQEKIFFDVNLLTYMKAKLQEQRGEANRQRKSRGIRGVWGCWEPLSENIWGFSQNHNLRNFEEFRGDISFNSKDFWGGLASPLYFALFTFLLPFPEKLQLHHHDPEKYLFTNSCVMDLHVKQATTLAKNSSI